MIVSFLVLGSWISPANPVFASDSYNVSANWDPEDALHPYGFWLCDPYDINCAIKPQDRARFQIMAAGYQPGAACAGNPLCLDTYATLVQITVRLGRAPSMADILYMIAGTEYFAYVDYPAQGPAGISMREVGQEALARNFYASCGLDGCRGDEFYEFLSGYQPWYGDPYRTEGSYSAAARAIELLEAGLFNDFIGTGDLLKQDINQILDLDYAGHESRMWTAGRVGNRPWSWFGPLRLSAVHGSITLGTSAEHTALLSAAINANDLLLMFTGDQDLNFNLAYLSPSR